MATGRLLFRYGGYSSRPSGPHIVECLVERWRGRAAAELERTAMEQDHYGAVFFPDRRHFLLLVRGGAELRLGVAVGELGSNVAQAAVERRHERAVCARTEWSIEPSDLRPRWEAHRATVR